MFVLCGMVLSLLGADSAWAQTEIEGEVSGEWNAEGSPYIVIDSTWVPEGEYNCIWGFDSLLSLHNNHHDLPFELSDSNILENPRFSSLDPFSPHLSWNSPCIDTGDPDSPEDPDGTRADIGAYYFDQRPGFVSYDENLSQFEIGVPYPNPFNSSFKQSFSIQIFESIGIRMFDIGGRLVLERLPEWYSPGYHSILISGSGLSTGTYFLNIHTDKVNHTVKLELLK